MLISGEETALQHDPSLTKTGTNQSKKGYFGEGYLIIKESISILNSVKEFQLPTGKDKKVKEF